MAAFAALLAYRGRPAAAPILPLAFAFAAQPLFFAGTVVGGLLAGVTVFLGGALAVAVFAPWRAWVALVVTAGVALAVAWVASVLVMPDIFDGLDLARVPVAAGFSVVGLTAVADRRRVQEMLMAGGRPGFVDVAYVGVCAGLLGAAAAMARVPLEILAVAAVLAIAVYPIWRRNAIAAFERFVTTRARRDAAILAIEEERGRLARDIHDAPLQDLAGVIRRLDAVPGTEGEADALRNVAARLRDMATTLRPPVLQDLGLVAAIEDLRDQLAGTYRQWEIVVDVDNARSGDRPPSDVELAALRVMQEATVNALAHSGGQRLEIRGSVAVDTVHLVATDDGRGFREDEARDARRVGHFGLDSMRERAESVDAEAVVTSDSDGVSVEFRWEQRA